MVKIVMTSDEDHKLLASNPIRVRNEADSDNLAISPENQSLTEYCFDDERLCHQCGQEHSYKLTGGSVIQEMISFLDRRQSDDI
jgi:hypothetical protein